MGILKSFTDLAGNAMNIISAPFEVAANVANAVIEPIAEMAEEIADEFRDDENQG